MFHLKLVIEMRLKAPTICRGVEGEAPALGARPATQQLR